MDEPEFLDDSSIVTSLPKYGIVDGKLFAYFIRYCEKEETLLVVVPGIVRSDPYPKNGVEVMDVEPIKDNGLQKKIQEMMKSYRDFDFR